jgi:hypothetical protein
MKKRKHQTWSAPMFTGKKMLNDQIVTLIISSLQAHQVSNWRYKVESWPYLNISIYVAYNFKLAISSLQL